MKPKSERYRVAVDFDGVLHSYTTPWVEAGSIPDPPVPGAIEWLKKIEKKFEVVIFTTRGRTPEGQQAVKDWLYQYGWEGADGCVVTNEKIPALVYIDDRGFRFEGTFPTAGEIHKLRPWNRPGGQI